MAGAQLRKDADVMHHEWMERRGSTLIQNPSTRERCPNETSPDREIRPYQGKGQHQGGGRGVNGVVRRSGTGPNAYERMPRRRRENASSKRGHRLKSRKIKSTGNQRTPSSPKRAGEDGQGIHKGIIRDGLVAQHGARAEWHEAIGDADLASVEGRLVQGPSRTLPDHLPVP